MIRDNTAVKHIFFDLDHTLWDFDRNSKLTFKRIFDEQNIPIVIDDFLEVYLPVNLKYWRLYREDKIEKNALRYSRLKETFDCLNYTISDDLIDKISTDYIDYLPNFNYLFKDALEVLNYLEGKYQLHIITNGFEEVQNLKLKKSGIRQFFKQIITSESVGVKKPNRLVFEYALKVADAQAHESVMVGDSYEADIVGALNSGLNAIHFTNEIQNNEVLSIAHLTDLKKYL
ncbi:YjjG family noncanonical pyrimidine nucleotidase [Tenacibaculum tangerinum]|uniref:YjjG family noncanonical pyrimidine nucleotidase n=1 Tax=Tenacibaculum tangerinum TaxID=3038772 RepID=A0ABY8L230_9FLAO|nr:YjjG family noncanonical pyrimidine nucleotidase [Tenacibaculum tangerinum]WGH75415.1 YjjG family noncanonical pyrimidine nucleotidase [Tenacibaculum tangerinum]